MRKYIFLTFTLLLTTTLIIAQPLNRSTYDFMIRTAEAQYEKKEYVQALKWYEDAYEESKDRELSITIAKIHLELRDYRDADRAYTRALRRDKEDKLIEHRFDYGRVLKTMGKYKEAIKEFDRYIAATDDTAKKELAEMEKAGAEYALVAQPVKDLNVTNAGKDVNNKKSEYSPVLAPGNKKLYYAAFLDDEVKEIDEKSVDFRTKIFVSERGDKGFAKGTEMDERINRPEVFNSNPKLSRDGKRMLLNEQTLDGNNLADSKVYQSTHGADGWSARKEINIPIVGSKVKSPAFGELFGNEVIFFSSDIDEGEGGYDIYYATHKGDGEYGDPVNLGPKINTPANEDTPYYRDGMLYFSSTGHPGLGGYDLFQSEHNGTRWSEPVNMGKGYNSSADDLSLMLDEEGYTGVFASNRISQGARSVHGKTCCTDIYFFTLKKIEASLMASVYDEEENNPISGATFTFIQVQEGDNKVIDSKTNSGGNGYESELELDVAYMMIATHENFEPDTIEFTTVGLLDSKVYQEKLYLKPLPKYITIEREEPFELENIYYDFDDDKILKDAEPDLQWIYDLMVDHPKIVIELSSHTDHRGEVAYNRGLSQRRAESARRWLVNKEIVRRRVVAKGYGESTPKTVDAKLADRWGFLNEGDVLSEEYIAKLESDSLKEIAHQINRRTEFKIVDGPTSITIKEERLIQIGNKKVQEEIKKSGSDKKTMPQNDPVKVHPWSSLYGKKSLKGFPVMKFENRMVELGKVKKGEKRAITYTFKNVGDTDLEIDLISACECTTLDYSTAVVKPGETGTIKAVFDSSKKDESETIDIDIYLKNMDPEMDMPIMEMLRYSYELEK